MGDGIRLALQALQQDGETVRVVRAACGAMQDLLLTEQDCQAALDVKAVPILTATLLRHGASQVVMTDGLSALLLLASNNRAQAQLIGSDILPELVRAMWQHKAQWDVVALSLALLVQLSSSRKGRALLSATPAIEFAIDVMMIHPRSLTIQCLGCEVLHRMVDGPIAQQRLLAMGALETLVEAVRRFPQERKLQRVALPALCQLCETEQTRTIMEQVGGVLAVLRAVGCNYEDLVVARYGCILLWELTLSSSMRLQIATAETKALVKKVLLHHSNDSVLLTQGRALLCRMRLSTNRTHRQVAGCGTPQPSSQAMHSAGVPRHP
eukprot:GGOE01023206.1.p1 GENE.GGOE01023206.1~~GGOE01023206.1.p1  ORF type:complete len:368 (-),score=114.28 GGOE01023206.1:646-1617(-)